MIITDSIETLKKYIEGFKNEKKSIGFIPTMGALHEGHKQLLLKAKNENDVVVCSVFVNPLQFNNANDLINYPRDIQADKAFIDGICDLLFIPTADKMYPSPPTEKYDFGELEKVMEGKFRPGHFNGVAVVVGRLFDYVQPDRAYFGQKDYQQLLIIKQLVKERQMPIEIESLETVREKDGLAISSRNRLLSPKERAIAPQIRRILCQAVELQPQFSPKQMEQYIFDKLLSMEEFQPEYVTVADAHTLQPIDKFEAIQTAIICVAVWLNNVRLIDNILINNNLCK